MLRDLSVWPETKSDAVQPIQPLMPPGTLSQSVWRRLLTVEFTLLFIAMPLALLMLPAKIPPLPLLWGLALYCLVALLLDPTFDRKQLWNAAPLGKNLGRILGLFAVCSIVLAEGVYFFRPQLFFEFVRHNPVIWGVVMLFYPIFSVFPQGIVYRAFLMHRYRPLASSPAMLIVMSAAAFSLMHILFRNPVAVSLTAAGGLLFAWRYHCTRSLAVSSFEHALYGCFLFTVGLGRFFFAKFV